MLLIKLDWSRRNLFPLIILACLCIDRFRDLNHVCTNYLSKTPFEVLFRYPIVSNRTARYFAVISSARNCVTARLFFHSDFARNQNPTLLKTQN